MSTSPPTRDRLRALLDIVVDSVNEDVGGSALAARAYLSRYHFDRLVAAAIGEPPGAFRRRLLLERAAYRLRFTSDAITDIALDAGYHAAEAFTRAFRRAYGRPPSALRRERDARLLLPAFNGIHFYPPGGLRLPAESRRPGMDVTTRLLEHDNWLLGRLLEVAGRLDREHLDRPITMSVDALDEGLSLRELLHTLVATKERWIAAVEGHLPPGGDPLGSHLPAAERTIDALRRRYGVAGPAFLRLATGIRERGEESATFIDATCETPRTFTYGDMIAHVLNFSAYRRTVALGALHEYGVDDLRFGDPVDFGGGLRAS